MSISVRFPTAPRQRQRHAPRRSWSSCVLVVALDDCLYENTRAEYRSALVLYSQLFLRYLLGTHHVGLVIVMSMSDCICQNQTNRNPTTRMSAAVAHTSLLPPYFQRMYLLMCSTSFGLRVIMKHARSSVSVAASLRDLLW